MTMSTSLRSERDPKLRDPSQARLVPLGAIAVFLVVEQYPDVHIAFAMLSFLGVAAMKVGADNASRAVREGLPELRGERNLWTHGHTLSSVSSASAGWMLPRMDEFRLACGASGAMMGRHG